MARVFGNKDELQTPLSYGGFDEDGRKLKGQGSMLS